MYGERFERGCGPVVRQTAEWMYGSHSVQWLFPYDINWLVSKMEVYEILSFFVFKVNYNCIDCVKSPTRCTFFVCVYSKICTLHVSSCLRITVYAAVCTYHAVTSCLASSGGTDEAGRTGVSNDEAKQLATVSVVCTNSCIYSDT